MMIYLIAWLKGKLYYKDDSIIFWIVLEGDNVNLKLGLSNYVTKAYLKEARVVDPSNLSAKVDLASLKTHVNKRDEGKLKTVAAVSSNAYLLF